MVKTRSGLVTRAYRLDRDRLGTKRRRTTTTAIKATETTKSLAARHTKNRGKGLAPARPTCTFLPSSSNGGRPPRPQLNATRPQQLAAQTQKGRP